MQYRFLCIYMPYRIILCIFYSVYVYIVFCCFVPKKTGCFIWKHLVSWSSGLLKFSQSKIPRKFEINRQRVQATQNFFSTFYFGKMLKDPTNSWWEDRVLPVKPRCRVFEFSRNFTSRKLQKPWSDHQTQCFQMKKTFFFKSVSL